MRRWAGFGVQSLFGLICASGPGLTDEGAPRLVFEPEMVIVPAGAFVMGSAEHEIDRSEDEGPPFRVEVAAFALGRFEVTRGEWAECVKAGACTVPPLAEFEEQQSLKYLYTDRHPIAGVTWDDAQAYVRWLSARTGRAYRLPSEAEWEYAARAGTTTRFSWGEDPEHSLLCDYANGADQTAAAQEPRWIVEIPCTDGYHRTGPVGSFKANAFGLHDMSGNVFEWVQDCWNAGYEGAPADGSARRTGDCRQPVIRGGSWFDHPDQMRSAFRGVADRDRPDHEIGFRVARSLP